MRAFFYRALSSMLPGALVRTGLIGLSLAAAIITDASAAAMLSPNADATATLAANVRYRNLLGSGPTGAAEIIITSMSGSTSGQRTWAFPAGISISYDGLNTLSTTAAGSATSRMVGDLGNLNYIQIQITKNGSSTSLALNNISLNGGGSLGSVQVSGAGNTLVWKITGADLTAGFTLSGAIAPTGLMGGGDSNFVQIDVGYVAPADNEGPITSSVVTDPVPAILNGMVTVSANVSDVTTGNNNIASAQFSIDGGPWNAMTAQDGAFSSPDEDVEASFTATTVGTHEVCVRGTDSLGNTGDAACQMYLVTYNFEGFFDPIDNDYLNVVKAGQAIPAKWRLTDANGVPISYSTSFVGLSSYEINCIDFSGDPLDSVEEVASGSSGLQYNGDGYWQYNWKTPKSYADTCRAMYVEFNSGALSPVVKFRFKK